LIVVIVFLGLIMGFKGCVERNDSKIGVGSSGATLSPNDKPVIVDIGSGADGPLILSTVFNINTQTNGYNSRTFADGVIWFITVDITSGQTIISSGLARPSGFAVGDEIMIINLQGTASDYNNVGLYEFKRIAVITGTASIIVDSVFTNRYNGVTQKIHVQRVPNYTDVTINTGGTITCTAWNGTTGGVIAFRANGTVQVNAINGINASGAGFRGGIGKLGNERAPGGEGYNGTGGTGGTYENNANRNGTSGQGGGGGGGDRWDNAIIGTGITGTVGSGGGGGGGGFGYYSDAQGVADGAYGGGGGGGGNATAGEGGWSMTNSGYDGDTNGVRSGGGGGDSDAFGGTVASYSDDEAYPGGGGGGGSDGRNGDASTLNQRAYMGGGGGAGGSAKDENVSSPSNNQYGGNGGNGGGIIYIAANIINVADTGTINADGITPDAPVNGPNENCIAAPGGGGGGAGGSIILSANQLVNYGDVTASGVSGSYSSVLGMEGGYGGDGMTYPD
jgi:hypothetical protein